MLTRVTLIDGTHAYIAADKVLCVLRHACGDDCDADCHRAGGTDVELSGELTVTLACGLDDSATLINEARNGLR